MTPITNTYRINLIDARGTISMLAPAHGPKMLTAIAGLDLESSRHALDAVSGLDPTWIEGVRRSLIQFDEFNVDALTDAWREKVEAEDSDDHPAFRVIDPVTRARSLQPGPLGLIVFNLREQRIIQVQNSGPEIERQGEGRYRIDGTPQERMYSYTLPDDWRLMP